MSDMLPVLRLTQSFISRLVLVKNLDGSEATDWSRSDEDVNKLMNDWILQTQSLIDPHCSPPAVVNYRGDKENELIQYVSISVTYIPAVVMGAQDGRPVKAQKCVAAVVGSAKPVS